MRTSSALLSLFVACNANAASPAGTHDADDSRISVTAVVGDVDATMAGQAANLEPAATLLLPARIVTGHDGTVGLTQAGTNISVANDTDVEIPAEAVDGNLIARLVQHSGNVFYDVAPRDLGKLRVETPFLVAVIKGTQFNVAVLEDSTTISLFEGSLEIRTPDDADVVQLNAGEIAIRSLIDDAIRVVGMNDDQVAVPRPAQRAAGETATPQAAANDDSATRVAVANDAVAARADGGAEVAAKPAVDSSGQIDEIRSGTAAVAVKPSVEVGGSELVVATLDTRTDVLGRADARFEKGVDVGGGSLEVALDTRIDVRGDTQGDVRGGGVGLGLGVGIDVDRGLGLDSALDVGRGAVDAGGDLGVGPIELNLDRGAADGDVGADAGLHLGRGHDTRIDTGLDLGAIDAGVDLGAGSTDLALDTQLDLGRTLDVGLDVDLDAGVVDLDLGSRGAAPAPAPAPPRRGGLLGGLL